MTMLVTGVLAALLTVGTVVGVTQAVGDSAPDRVQPSTSAPVYGTP